MTGEELRHWRTKVACLTQGDLGSLLSVSQKTISLYENDRTGTVPEWVEQRVQSLDSQPKDKWTLADTPTQSFSWPQDLYPYVWNTAPRRAASVELKATLRAESAFTATCEIEICFTLLELNRNDFYFDHIGPLELAPTKEDQGWRVSTMPTGMKKATYNFTTILEETPEELRGSSPGQRRGLAYRILQVAPEAETRVFLRTPEPVPHGGRDFIGFPVYSDLAVRELSIELRLEGLAISTNGPSGNLAAVPRALTIRRTQFTDEPSMVAPLGPEEVLAERCESGAQIVTLGPLHRPRGGYMYAIVWSQLKNA